MRKLVFLILFPVLCFYRLTAQTLTSSNLPIMIITTDGGAAIIDNPRVLATMKIIYRGEGQRNYVSDQNTAAYLNYNGRIDIEIRGSSSQATDKKQYGFTTREADNVSTNNVSLLGMPEENDWIINGMVFDPARMRDYLCYTLSRQLGEYASRTAYCELIINGQYMGLYLLEEKIKADKNRVNVIKIGTTDNYLPELSGGYITKADKTTGGDVPIFYIGPAAYIHDLPKPELATSEQTNYIYGVFSRLADVALNHNMSLINGIPSVIDIPSFIDHMLISEISSNADSYQFSTFFHKDRNGKLRAGPLWDNDLTFGNDLFQWGFDRSHTDVWQFADGGNVGSRFWSDMFNTSLFKCYMSKRWNELVASDHPLNLTHIDNMIDQASSLISEAIGREYTRWSIPGTFSAQTTSMKTWLASRITWMTTNLGSYDICNNISLPSLVISKINYHPEASSDFPSSDDLEFIEITNTGTTSADLTGIYFAGTGLVFQFPVGSSVQAGSSVYLAGNIDIFKLKYGFTPFGKFTRDLSNKDQNLVLADGYGNIIDQVHYYDSAPWPDADGNGSYLKLIDNSLDNSLPENWTASADNNILDVVNPTKDYLKIYPNPVDNILNISAGHPVGRLEIFDIQGRELVSEDVPGTSFELNVSNFPKGAYIVRISSQGKTYTKGIIKR